MTPYLVLLAALALVSPALAGSAPIPRLPSSALAGRSAAPLAALAAAPALGAAAAPLLAPALSVVPALSLENGLAAAAILGPDDVPPGPRARAGRVIKGALDWLSGAVPEPAGEPAQPAVASKPAADSNEPSAELKLALTPAPSDDGGHAAQRAWDEVMAEVEAAANGVRTGRPVGALLPLMKAGIDDLLDEIMVAAQSATREEANQLSRRLDHFAEAARYSAVQSRRLQNLKTGLDNYERGRAPQVLIDRTPAVRDSAYEAMGLAEGNMGLLSAVSAAFAAGMDARLPVLEPGARLELLQQTANQSLLTSDALYTQLWRSSEWSNFAGNRRAYALERLAAIGTVEALSAAALQTSTYLGLSGPDGRLDRMATRILKSAAPAVALAAIRLAQREVAHHAAPYNSRYDPSGERARELEQQLRRLAKDIASRP